MPKPPSPQAGNNMQWRNYMGPGDTGGTFPPAEVCAPPGAPVQNFEKIGPHLRLQDTKCSSNDMPP